MNEQQLAEIKKRHTRAMPAPEWEPTFRDEVWIIRHLEEIIMAYRKDIPDLIAEIERLRAELDKALKHCAALEVELEKHDPNNRLLEGGE